jgi:predicted RNA-binding Zn-ribbon protein involved in translation (DUF1610 family)
VEFAPGTEALICPYCGDETHIPASEEGLDEQDFEATLVALERDAETEESSAVQCPACAALVEPEAAQEAFPCPYCGSGIVATARSDRRIKPAALLPFRVDRAQATRAFRTWIKRLWFAPNALKRLAQVEGRLRGLYAPYWTYDSDTASTYTGQRGDDYTVTRTRTVVRDGKPETETYTEVETNWTRVRGRVARDFDDVLVVGSNSLPRTLAEELEPWDLGELVAYADEYLSGFTAERYQVDLRTGWKRAVERMTEVIRTDVRSDIGGDRQRIDSLRTTHSAVTFKHVLLPMWICSYRYRDKIYRFLVNARTGEVQGQRPWSWVKITLAVVATAVVSFAVHRLLTG